MSDLHAQLQSIASAFASEVLKAIRGASLDDIVGEVHAPTPVKHESRQPRKIAKKAPRKAAPVKKPAKTSKAQKRAIVTATTTYADRTAIVNAIVAHVKAHPGAPSDTIKKALRIEGVTWQRAIAKAVDARLIRRKGKTKGATYFVGDLA